MTSARQIQAEFAQHFLEAEQIKQGINSIMSNASDEDELRLVTEIGSLCGDLASANLMALVVKARELAQEEG